jgi:hypothetical protein
MDRSLRRLDEVRAVRGRRLLWRTVPLSIVLATPLVVMSIGGAASAAASYTAVAA